MITLFAQILQYLPKEEIRRIIREHDTDKHSKGCDTWPQLISLVFCQFSDCVSLRDTAYVYITDGKGADNTSAWSVRVPPHSIVVADRGYCDFGLLNHWDSSSVTFVVRHLMVAGDAPI